MSTPEKVNPHLSQFSNDALWLAHRAFAAARDLMGQAEYQANRAFHALEGMDAAFALVRTDRNAQSERGHHV